MLQRSSRSACSHAASAKEDYAEVAVLQRLAGHRYVVMLFGVWIHGSKLNMLMERCNGSLDDVIKAKSKESRGHCLGAE